jgi:co-chaperonin GroES (HSP10)
MKKKTLTPLKDGILVCLDARQEETSGGIVIPQEAQQASEWGVVVAAGDKCVDLKQGDRVLILRTQGTHYRHEGKDMILVNEARILAKEEA